MILKLGVLLALGGLCGIAYLQTKKDKDLTRRLSVPEILAILGVLILGIEYFINLFIKFTIF